MKYVLFLFIGVILASCGTKIPYTSRVADDFGLDNEKSMAKVQFFTSATIIIERSKSSGNQNTTSDGTLVSNSSSEKDRIIIPLGTKCVFEKFDEDNNIVVRFEPGVGHTISFGKREGQSSGKYYLLADWTSKKGGEMKYGNSTYFANTASGTAYLQVVKKKLQKTKRKDRVVKGMKV
ncbi:MAG: hypothetical protein MK066_00550 [Crocinitomicaceae bacterium]|nr:hypothetical protein [Crocinitomicaceae bacterium]